MTDAEATPELASMPPSGRAKAIERASRGSISPAAEPVTSLIGRFSEGVSFRAIACAVASKDKH